ncbi:hypothetical protein HER18_09145 [Chryseobacterium sp. NEB161]|nr:hypothetical protein HER18_09145 [Chryseobacterium sp. NEB161]
MTTYNVSVPDNKNAFFLEILEMIGANYEKNDDGVVELSEQHKKILEERLKADKKDFIPARKAMSQLREKYGL